MEIKQVYEGEPSREISEAISDLDIEVEEIDAEKWDEDERFDFYMGELMPLSIQNHVRLKGRVRTHQAGKISFEDEVLIMDGEKLAIGEKESLEALEEAGATA